VVKSENRKKPDRSEYIRATIANLDQMITDADAHELDHFAALLSRARDALTGNSPDKPHS